MIFVFCEDSGLEIAEDEDEVTRNYEGVDVESGVYSFFADNGLRLLPVFDRPVQERRFLWLFRTIDSGQYHLEKAIGSDHDPLWMEFNEVSYIAPNRHFDSIVEARDFLRKRGAAVDAPTDQVIDREDEA